ncbi:MAG: hypothetical protein NC043_00320 [Muribaculaceae bacterium]|nr:hypothetical protein [Muribaculaceae bacterium]
MGLLSGTELFTIVLQDDSRIPASEMTLSEWGIETLKADANATVASEKRAGKAVKGTFTKNGLSVQWRAVLRDGSHYLRTEMSISAVHDTPMHSIIPLYYRGHTLKPGAKAPEVVGNTRGAILASEELFAGIETPTGLNEVFIDDAATEREGFVLRGIWRRHTTLKSTHPWDISTVVGLMAPGQMRRSVLAYSERERAVPWRPFNIYNSWYELNIDRNNSPTYADHMTIDDCVRVIDHWQDKLTDRSGGANIEAFVWDDGWDNYGTWTFNPNFPNGFREADSAAARSGAGIGAWLGPVGGYGRSGQLRREYWKDKGGMQLSNPAYYDVFLRACRDMIDNYDFRFFKLDGISAQGVSVGPDPGYRGEENAEGIIDIQREVRKMKPDMFFNTTVGTWASPFWFHFTDAVWRQQADHSTIGDQGDDRERWITYRDHMVHDIFVRDSPLCPINTLMTHGVILTRYGDVSKSMDYDGIVREIRCAYACGSGMVELYTDYELLDSINGGRLWQDIAECINWQKRNADVLPDAHWVGGNPWDGKKANVYGWASWNGKKATLALRNPAASPQEFTTTLRKALDIPAYVTGPVTLTDAFSQQALPGLDTGKPIDPDTVLHLTLPASSVFVYDGVQM